MSDVHAVVGRLDSLCRVFDGLLGYPWLVLWCVKNLIIQITRQSDLVVFVNLTSFLQKLVSWFVSWIVCYHRIFHPWQDLEWIT